MLLRVASGMIFALVLGYARLGTAAQAAPDAPRAAAPVTALPHPPIAEGPAMAASVELKSVSVRRPDETQKKMAGAAFLKRASEPLVIEVVAQKAFPAEPRTSSPVIVLNGEKFVDTWVVLPDKLVAFVPDRSKIKDVNRVEVMWLGNEKATLTKQPLTFRRTELPR